ncbi:uncharacterized protein TNCV_824501 [Trichonephila clavipes]|nr:uncharacterized protein TNCV_824501 [Trichonephila clavipes]
MGSFFNQTRRWPVGGGIFIYEMFVFYSIESLFPEEKPRSTENLKILRSSPEMGLCECRRPVLVKTPAPYRGAQITLNMSRETDCLCAFWAGGIIGPYFFKNDEGHNVTVNGDRYRAVIIYFFIPEFNNHDVQELWFQQDGATCHTARATIDLLKDTFGDRLISRFGPVNWPPRSCDLTPLDYFLWGYVKSLVYADKPQTLDHLEDNIRRVIVDIRPQMLEKVIENWTSRLDYIRASRGSPMPEIIFKM